MHVHADGSDIARHPTLPVNRPRTTQNARSAIMGESSAADVCLNTQSRMVLVAFLVFTYCFTACQAKLANAYPPVYLPEATKGMVSGDGFRQTDYVVPVSLSGKAKGGNEGNPTHPDARSRHDFIMAYLLANEINDRVGDISEHSKNAFQQVGNGQLDDRVPTLTERRFPQLKEDEENDQETNLGHFGDLYEGSPSPLPIEEPSLSQLYDVIYDGNHAEIPDDSAQNVDFVRMNTIHKSDTPEMASFSKGPKYFPNDFDASDLDLSSYGSDFLPENTETISDIMNTSPSFGDSQQYARSDSATQPNQKPANRAVRTYFENGMAQDTSDPMDSYDSVLPKIQNNGDNLDDLRSLIQNTVMKMEDKLNAIQSKVQKRRYNEPLTTPSFVDSKKFVDEDISPFTNEPTTTMFAWKSNGGFHIVDDDDDDGGINNNKNNNNYKIDYNDDEEEEYVGDDMDELSPAEVREYEDHALAVILEAIETQTIPEDFEFWRNVSQFLDNDTNYLSRTKRAGRRWKARRRFSSRRHLYQQLRRRVSITYAHVVPCARRDRFYCLNGGTCVFVAALDIKTCRCPIGYTGFRCQRIDQEYILRLLTNSIIQ